jgi:hypothetical protein
LLGPWPHQCRPRRLITAIDAHQSSCSTCVYKLRKLQKTSAQGQVMRYKHIKGPHLPYIVLAVKPRLLKRVTSFLLDSKPLWCPPPPPRSWPPHSHLYYSPKKFPMESHLLLRCTHKIPNRADVTSEFSYRGIAAPSMASGFPKCSTVASIPHQALPHKVHQGMYYPMLHMNSSLGAGTEIGGGLSTSQAFF